MNVLIDRLPKDESVIKGRSYCDHCKKNLRWYDLIPLVSFLYLKGKCRNCQSPISFYYPIVELTTGFLFVGVLFFLGGNVYYLFIVSCLAVIFFTDLKYGIIPDKIVYPAVLVSFIFLISQYPNILISNIMSAVVAFLFFFLLYIVTRGRGMGFGDVKLVFLLGLFLGWPKIIVAFYIAFLTGAILGCILILWRKKRLHGGTIPFGPFLAAGAIAAMFWNLDLHYWNFL